MSQQSEQDILVSSYKFSWNKFLIKLTSAAMWAWAFACILVTIVCIQDGDHDWIKYVVIGWIIISCCFIGGKVIVDAFAEATRNAKIEANIGMPKMGGKT